LEISKISSIISNKLLARLCTKRIGRGRSDPPIGLSTPELNFSTTTAVVVVVIVIITLVEALDHVIGKSSMVAGRSGRRAGDLGILIEVNT